MNKILLIALPLLTFQAYAEAPNIKEGLWQITSKVIMSGMPVEVPSTTKEECVTRTSLNPEEMLKEHNCQFNKTSGGANAISWTMSCEEQGMKMDGTGSMTYKYNSFDGKFDLQMSGGAAPIKMSTSIIGKYIGACSR